MLHKLKLTTEGQTLTSESLKLASGLVEEIECEFELDSSWEGFDYLRALFTDNYGDCIEKTLVNGKCNVPQECLAHKGWCKVNLCAYDVVSQQKVLQQTSYMTKIADITQEVATSGSNAVSPTVAVWEQELLNHTSNTTVHTTAQEKSSWDAKLNDAPSDNKQYARKNGEWAEVEAGSGSVSWNDITNKPSTFPPSSHTQAWSTITDKPETYPPSTHTHDDRYYTETETDTLLNNKVDKVDGKGLSTNDYTDADKQKVANAITEHQSLANYYNKSETDSAISAHHDSTKVDTTTLADYSTTAQMNSAISGHHDSSKQDVISDLSTIRSGASAGATAVQPSAISDMATQTWVGQQGFLTSHQDISGKADKRAIKTTMDSVAVVGCDYFLGEQSSVAITMPSTPSTGDMISVVFYSGATATSLSVSGSTIGTIPTPSANQRVEMNMVYDGTYWAVLSNVMAVA